MLLGGLIDNLTGANRNGRLKGTVVLMRKNVLDLNDFGATIIDGVAEFIGKGVTCQLVSSTIVDHSTPLFTSFSSVGGHGRIKIASACALLTQHVKRRGSRAPDALSTK